MRLPKFKYLEARTIQEVCDALREYGEKARVMGGGTDLLVSMKQRLVTPSVVVGLRKLPGMGTISCDPIKGLEIGALTTIFDIERSSLVRRDYPMLAEAAREVASPHLRRMGTIGGNLCLDSRCLYYNQSHLWRRSLSLCFKQGGELCNAARGADHCYAVYSGDLPPPLMAMEAKIRLTDGERERVIPVENLFSGDGKRPIAIGTQEIVTNVIFPPIRHGSGKFLKYRVRGSIDFPLVNVAVFIRKAQNGRCENAKIIVGGVDSAPLRMKEAEEILQGEKLCENLLERAAEACREKVRPVNNTGGSPAYRRRMVHLLIKEALRKTWEN